MGDKILSRLKFGKSQVQVVSSQGKRELRSIYFSYLSMCVLFFPSPCFNSDDSRVKV